MNKHLSLSIPKPCSKKWDDFVPTTNGGFCSSCSKVVVDFTKMTDDQIHNFFESQSSGSCGRFRTDQLKVYQYNAKIKVTPSFVLLKAGLVGLLLLLIYKPTLANRNISKASTEIRDIDSKNDGNKTAYEYVVSGVVKDEDGAVLPGVNVYLQGAAVGTSTDEEGRFEFPRKLKKGDVLLFSFIGFEIKEYVIREGEEEGIEISMVMDVSFTTGEVAVEGPYEAQPATHTLWTKLKGIF